MPSTKDNLIVLYQDNHIIIVNKRSGDIVQGDKTGDKTLCEVVKEYLKEKYKKEGNVYLGVVHRLDRPTTGIVVFAKTSKALPRLNKLFSEKNGVKKIYWAIVEKKNNLPREGQLVHYLVKNEKNNKSKAYNREIDGAKKAQLKYKIVRELNNYSILEIELLSGRHHQIRSQLEAIGVHIKGDLKYGSARSNKDGGISLHSKKIVFQHPVSKKIVDVEADFLSDEKLWKSQEC